MKVVHVWTVLGMLIFCNVHDASADDAQSMFDPKTYRSPVSEYKAAQVGDVLTVVVQEAATATSTVDSKADRKASASAQVASTKVGVHGASAGSSTDNEGGGRTQRTGRLAAQLSVRVLEILSNGDLIVFGQQSITVNGEEQTITLRGVVRPQDVGDGNTVASSRIAEANIQFVGEGFIADKSKPGWLSRLLTTLGF